MKIIIMPNRYDINLYASILNPNQSGNTVSIRTELILHQTKQSIIQTTNKDINGSLSSLKPNLCLKLKTFI